LHGLKITFKNCISAEELGWYWPYILLQCRYCIDL